MSVVEHTSVVTMDLQLFAEDGRLVQNVKDHVFIQGIDDVFPAMASHLSGKQVGEDVEGELSAVEAFGEIQPYEVVTYPKLLWVIISINCTSVWAYRLQTIREPLSSYMYRI